MFSLLLVLLALEDVLLDCCLPDNRLLIAVCGLSFWLTAHILTPPRPKIAASAKIDEYDEPEDRELAAFRLVLVVVVVFFFGRAMTNALYQL